MSLKVLLCVVLFLVTILGSDDTLLKMGSKDNCIKMIIESYLHQDDCHKMNDSSKTELAFQMTNCLLRQMKKQPIAYCKGEPCPIEGDAWNTFSTFFNHIDNLCHFYRQIIWQERAEHLVVSLTNSASTTYQLLQKNSHQTNQILNMQSILKEQMIQTVEGQREMIALIGNSSVQLGNLTKNLQSFVLNLHKDIDQHYSSLQIVLRTISGTLQSISSFQGYLMAEVNTINGLLFYLLMFLGTIVGFSLKKNQNERSKVYCILAFSFLAEWMLGVYINAFLGNRVFRCAIIGIIGMSFLNSYRQPERLERAIFQQLKSERMIRLLRKAIQQ